MFHLFHMFCVPAFGIWNWSFFRHYGLGISHLSLHSHPVIREESSFLNPGEIAFALFWRHGFTDLDEMLEHRLLALKPKLRCLGELFLDFRSQDVRPRQEKLQLRG